MKFFESRIIKNKRCFIFKGYLKNDFEYYPKYGCINENAIIKKDIAKCLIARFYNISNMQFKIVLILYPKISYLKQLV